LGLSGLNANDHCGTGVSPVDVEGAGGIGGLLGLKFQAASPNRDYLFFMDGNGNVGQLIASSNPSGVSLGDVASRYEYDPYGNRPIELDPGGSANMYMFSSKFSVYDFYYYGERWLLPRLGRWGSRDPIEEFGGVNQYAGEEKGSGVII